MQRRSACASGPFPGELSRGEVFATDSAFPTDRSAAEFSSERFPPSVPVFALATPQASILVSLLFSFSISIVIRHDGGPGILSEPAVYPRPDATTHGRLTPIFHRAQKVCCQAESLRPNIRAPPCLSPSASLVVAL